MAVATYEHSTLKLNKTSFNNVMREMRKVNAIYLNEIFLAAEYAYKEIKKVGKNNIDFYALFPHYRASHGIGICQFQREQISTELFRGKNGALCKPRKSAFKGLTNKDKSFTIDISYFAYMTFDHEKSTITWCVDEGNHSVEEANRLYQAKELFKNLSAVNWRNGEGGYLTYWNENMSEDLDDDYCRESDEDCRVFYGKP